MMVEIFSYFEEKCVIALGNELAWERSVMLNLLAFITRRRGGSQYPPVIAAMFKPRSSRFLPLVLSVIAWRNDAFKSV